jgi:signal transduction histidine kinase
MQIQIQDNFAARERAETAETALEEARTVIVTLKTSAKEDTETAERAEKRARTALEEALEEARTINVALKTAAKEDMSLMRTDMSLMRTRAVRAEKAETEANVENSQFRTRAEKAETKAHRMEKERVQGRDSPIFL